MIIDSPIISGSIQMTGSVIVSGSFDVAGSSVTSGGSMASLVDSISYSIVFATTV